MKGLAITANTNGKTLSLREGLIKPTPEKGEVLVKIHSASVNPFDQETVDGRFDEYYAEYNVNKEVLSGLEFSGTIVGNGDKFKDGDAVFGYVDMIVGWKTHAEYIAINEDYIALKPDNIDFVQAASLPLGSLTTLVAFEIANISEGNNVLINGAAGGLGVQGIQVAKALGANVYAISGSGQEAFLKSLGADQVYDYNKIDLASLQSKFDIILDLTNKRTFDEIKHLLTETGKFVPAEPNDQNGGTLDSPNVGYLMVSHGDGQKLSRIAEWIKEEKVIPVVDKVYSFHDHKAAFERTAYKGKIGRIVMNW